jgi:hypothetical protein
MTGVTDMSNLSQFAKQIRSFNRVVEKEAESLTQRVLLTVQDAVVTSTPIDTSRARTNWVPSIGEPATSEVPFVPGVAGSTAAEAHRIAMDAAKQIAGQIKLGNKVWLSNNVPYIRQLNAGSSQQAPAMFVEKAAEVGRNVK